MGAGEAGAGVAFALRQNGYDGPVTLIGEEPHVPYRRPPLSKAYLTGEMAEAALAFRGAEAYERAGINCLTGIRAQGIDRNRCLVKLADGSGISYQYLVLATGGRARRLALPVSDHPRIHYVRTIDDVRRLRTQFVAGSRLVILGGGFIGLEIAATGVKSGLQVTVAEALPRLLARVSAPVVSEFYAAAHRSRGVEVLTNRSVASLTDGDGGVEVHFSDGTHRLCDLIIAGVGMVPTTDLAESAALEVDNGIVVDSRLMTSDPRIFAVGDCCNYLHTSYLGRRVRLESVPNAADHARICAAAICGRTVPLHAVPWFWSDQYDLKLQIAGLSSGYDAIAMRGRQESESFSVFYLRAGAVIAADSINRPADFTVARKLVAHRVLASIEDLENDNIPLSSLLPR